MKKLLILLLFPVLCNAQARIGVTQKELREDFPSNTFEQGYTDTGVLCLLTEFKHGVFYYYFDSNGKTKMNVLYPKGVNEVNAVVENYNKKYVIINDKSWKAYLADGSMIYITLSYSEAEKTFLFYYTP